MRQIQFKINSYFFYSFFLIFFITHESISQEQLIGLESNYMLYEDLKKKKSITAIADSPIDTIEIPFLDDFSKPTHFPDASLWSDKEVFVNYTRGVDPPSIGVATFDMFDHNGNLHKSAKTGIFLSDSLTSKPINLFYPGNDRIYLSFNYQRKGHGEMPDEQDSLVVEFYSPLDASWKVVYSVSGNGSTDFTPVIIPVNEERYVQKGFRFRFKNYASFESAQSNPYWQRDGDHWHLDMVYLDTGRAPNDTLVEDISIVNGFRSLLETYTSIPWNHADEKILDEERIKKINFTCENNFSSVKNVHAEFSIKDNILGNYIPTPTIGNKNIAPFSSVLFNQSVNYNISSVSNDSAKFKVQAYIEHDVDASLKNALLRNNDTITFIQEFKDYYSYDDGTAEFGYGLVDEGADNARFAQRFNIYKEDTIQGAYIAFLNNNLPEGEYPPAFHLGLWKSNNNKPGELIYAETGLTLPDVRKGVNAFYYYPFDSNIVVKDTFFIGIIQTTDDFLNIGFDVNNVNKSQLFFNLYSDWIESSFDGSLMIRPGFADEGAIVSIAKNQLNNSSIDIYPNPASNYIQYSINGIDNPRITFIEIYNTSGLLVKKISEINNSIMINDLSEGVYFIRFFSKHSYSKVKRVVIQR